MRLHNAYKWPFWEHIIDHNSKTGNVSSLKFSGKHDLTMLFCITSIKCSFITQFFCSIDITWKNLNQHQYSVLAVCVYPFIPWLMNSATKEMFQWLKLNKAITLSGLVVQLKLMLTEEATSWWHYRSKGSLHSTFVWSIWFFTSHQQSFS